MVIDLRRVNREIIPNGYPLLRQDNIVNAVGGTIFFSIDGYHKRLFSTPSSPQDRWKTGFVTSHRGHEQLTVAPDICQESS